MQVTHVADNVTHAVIGAGQARDFGISNSAEFFNILSNTLYSDKIMAVVREVLCNAWDIHIQTGRTDKSVEVSLMDGKLTIRDFGTGISDDDIHPIYAVYGNSTKKLDGTQTGGFGLGSKAPFAYVDHFEVTSYHAGRKTIYAVSKSSAEVAGKPSIMPLVSVPCGEETGLSVSMAVKYEDESRFKSVIEMIARFGEMNVQYTDRRVSAKKLTTIPFSQAKHGFLMSKDVEGVSGSQNNTIFVRYGNVVYPVPDHEKFKTEYARVNKMIQKVGNSSGYYHGGTKWKIIFQAKPNTISVTPSRESLSMTDHTANSLLDVFKAFLALTENQLFDVCLQIERECVETVFQTGRVVDLLDSDNKVPTLFDQNGGYSPHRAIVQEPTHITTLDQMGRGLMSKTYPDFPNFRKRDVQMRLDIVEKSGLGGPKNRGKIQSFRREYEKNGNAVGQAWFQQTLVVPLVKRLDEVPELSGSKLLVYGDHTDTREDKNGRRRNWSEGKKFIEATKLSRRNLEGYLPFLRNIAVISFNRIDVEERLPKFPIFKEKLGDTQDFFVYVVSRADKKIDIVRKFFEDQGMTVVDLTVRQDWEPQHVMQPVPKAKIPVKPREKEQVAVAKAPRPNKRTAEAETVNTDETKTTGAPKVDVKATSDRVLDVKLSEQRKLFEAQDWTSLYAFKKAKKKGWDKLGFTAAEEQIIADNNPAGIKVKEGEPQVAAEITVVPEPEPKPEPKAEPAKVPAKKKAAPASAPVQAPTKEPTRQEKAKALLHTIDKGKTKADRQQAYQDLLALKKASKVGWMQLGVDNFDAIQAKFEGK